MIYVSRRQLLAALLEMEEEGRHFAWLEQPGGVRRAQGRVRITVERSPRIDDNKSIVVDVNGVHLDPR